MAWAKILHTWPDGSTDELEVGTETGYPDALAELVARVSDLYRLTCQQGDV